MLRLGAACDAYYTISAFTAQWIENTVTIADDFEQNFQYIFFVCFHCFVVIHIQHMIYTFSDQ